MEIICLSGFARSGKDEAAKVLIEEFGFTQIAFADKLRDALYTLNPVVVADPEHHGPVPVDYGGPVYRRLKDIIDEWGWEEYKTCPFSRDIRYLIQTLGTDVGRNMLGKNIWVDATLSQFGDSDRVVVSDGRFFNEFDAVKERGGYIWRIDRIGVEAANNHPSETEAVDYDGFDTYLVNDGTLEEWRRRVRREYILTTGDYNG